MEINSTLITTFIITEISRGIVSRCEYSASYDNTKLIVRAGRKTEDSNSNSDSNEPIVHVMENGSKRKCFLHGCSYTPYDETLRIDEERALLQQVKRQDRWQDNFDIRPI